MANKQIYAAVEIADHEIRFVVGEFYETRFNILRVERVRFTGIENHVITSEANVVSAIIKACNNASNILGYKIERVLLAIPCVNVQRHGRKVNVVVANSKQQVHLTDIQRGINEAIQLRPYEESELVNIGCIKYITNGISSRKLPINEICDQFTIDIDLFYADKKIIYSYVRCVEQAGLEILDICIDSYAIAEEAAIFEKTIENYVVLVNLARQNTTLSLFSRGKLLSCESIESGYGEWVSALKDATGIQTENAFRLIVDNATFKEDANQLRPIFIWSSKNEQRTLNTKELNELLMSQASKWVETLNRACEPIKEMGNMKYILTGEGLEIQGIKNLLPQLNAGASVYVPQTIGGRNCALSVCLGMFYTWKTLNEIRLDSRTCAQQAEIEVGIQGSKTQLDEEHGFTKKLKNILLNEK